MKSEFFIYVSVKVPILKVNVRIIRIENMFRFNKIFTILFVTNLIFKCQLNYHFNRDQIV